MEVEKREIGLKGGKPWWKEEGKRKDKRTGACEHPGFSLLPQQSSSYFSRCSRISVPKVSGNRNAFVARFGPRGYD